MKISFNWLKDWIDLPEAPSGVGDRLTLIGLAVDSVERSREDTIFELDVTANRGDCLSHLGVARELAAAYGTGIRFPETKVSEGRGAIDGTIAISIEDSDLCRRYCGRYISGVTIGPSPDWLRERLLAVGVRPVNNVADITNYVLMDLGHPLHAFDADTLAGSRIIVRRAAAGETIRTIDGSERVLDPSMLVIADENRPVALAGIMGSVDTEISEGTTNVLLESAWFDPNSVRQTARRVHLGTEASYRFERGADLAQAPVALDRTARLISEIAGGTVRRGVIDQYPGALKPLTLVLHRDRIEGHLGGTVPDDAVERVFHGLGFDPSADDSGTGWRVRVPSYRHDIRREEDLLEEVARHYGYDRFPSTLPAWSGQGTHLKDHAEESLTREVLTGMGYSETCSIAFSDRETEDRFAPGVVPVALRSPLSEKSPILRTALVPSVLRSVLWNLNRGLRDLSLYEIGKVYPASGEYRQLVLARSGAAQPPSVHHPQRDTTLFVLKGDVENLLSRFAVEMSVSQADLPAYYHPGRALRLGSVALLGELGSDAAEFFKLRQRVYVAEVRIEELFASGLKNIAATPIPKYPAVRRDLSLIVDRQTAYGDLMDAIDRAGVSELVDVIAFDRLDQGPFPESCYSMAVTLVFQSEQGTLNDVQIEQCERSILEALHSIGVQLRS